MIDVQHNGYERFTDPAVHRRWLISPPQDITVAVVDLLDGRTEQDIAVSWPLHADLSAALSGNGDLFTRDGDVKLEVH